MERSIILLLGLLLAGCDGGSSPPPPPPPQPQPQPSSVWTVGPVINGVNYSPGVVWSGNSFTFPNSAPGVHGLTRSWGSIGSGVVTLKFRIDGNATFTEVDAGGGVPGDGLIRLFLQRCGDDWSGGARASYRFYSQPMALGLGEQVLSAPLVADVWTNVNGQVDAAGFAAALADLCTAGMGFGGMFAMHGVIANGSATFNLLSFGVE